MKTIEIGTKLIFNYHSSTYTITGKLMMGKKWILTNDVNSNETLRYNNYELNELINKGKLTLI